MSKHVSLGTEFDVVNRDDWLALVDKVLKGSAFDDALVTHDRDGIAIQPLYSDDGSPADWSARGRVDQRRLAEGWDVRQRHGGATPDVVNAEILEDLERGVMSIELHSVVTTAEIERALEGVLGEFAPIALAPHDDGALAQGLLDVAGGRSVSIASSSSLGLDPIGQWARRGVQGDTNEAAGLVAKLRTSGHLTDGVKAFVVDGVRYFDAGATSAQTLAWGTATGVAYLRALTEGGLSVDDAASLIGFRWPAGAEQFATTSMLRSARIMWARVVSASGGSKQAGHQYQQAVTSLAMYSERDPWVNLLRATSAALGAGVGGADSVTVLPFDSAAGRANELGRRMARNTQLLLIEESHLGRTTDPAGGAYYVEDHTQRVAREAWSQFQAVDGAGGIEAAIAAGSVADSIEEAWARRLEPLRTRAEPLTGVTEFPDLHEVPLDRQVAAPNDYAGLPLRRLAQPFELLRDAADRHLVASGRRPTVHVCALGSEADHSMRTTWLRNLLAVGGVTTSGGDGAGAESPLAAEAAFAADGPEVAVISSTDAMYGERGVATAIALKEAGAKLVAVVESPDALRDELEAAGVDEFWSEGADVIEILERLHSTLGVAATR